MKERDHSSDILRFWPRLRREAHDLYREAGILRGRVRELERQLAASEGESQRTRAENERLVRAAHETRARLRAIQRSRGWIVISGLRRARRWFGRGGANTPQTSLPPDAAESARLKPSFPAPTFSQRWAAQARHRAEIKAALLSWIDTAREASGDSIVVIAVGRPGLDEAFLDEAFVARCIDGGDAVCCIDVPGDPSGLRGTLPPGVEPSLVPDLLGMKTDKRRLFLCGASDAGVRWAVAAQQDGWKTVLLCGDSALSPPLRYLAAHVDAVVARNVVIARALELELGVSAIVLSEPTPRTLLDVCDAAPPSPPRAVLGIG